MTNQPFMNTAHYGTVFSKDGHDIDDCVVTKFNNPLISVTGVRQLE